MNISNLREFTKKEVFTFISNHLLAQLERCVDEYNTCKHLGVNGSKCAIGCLMTEDQAIDADSDTDDSSIEIILERNEQYDIGHHEQLLCDMQYIHDHVSVSDWQTTLSEYEEKL